MAVRENAMLPYHQFINQQVIRGSAEPVAIAYGNRYIFVLTKTCHVEVYEVENGSELPTTMSYIFRTTATATHIQYSRQGNYVAAIETENSSDKKKVHQTARVYFNWSLNTAHLPVYITRVGGHTSKLPKDYDKRLQVIELINHATVCSLTCCQTTGNIAVSTGTLISIFVLVKVSYECENIGQVTVYEPRHAIDLHLNAVAMDISLCQSYVGLINRYDFQIIRIEFNNQNQTTNLVKNGSVADDNDGDCTNDYNTHEMAKRLTNSSVEKDVNFVELKLGRDDRNADKMPTTYVSQESDGENCEKDLPTSTIILPTILRHQLRYGSERKGRDLFGPILKAKYQSLKVVIDEQYRSTNQYDVTILLYKKLTNTEYKDMTDLVSSSMRYITLLPTYVTGKMDNTAERGLHDLLCSSTSKICGMTCFASTSVMGYHYSLTDKAYLLSQYNYPNEIVDVSVSENLLYVIASDAVIVYTIALHSDILPGVRYSLSKSQCISDNQDLSGCTDANQCRDDTSIFDPQELPILEHYTCSVGLCKFTSLIKIVAFSSRIILLAKVIEKSSTKKVSSGRNWSLSATKATSSTSVISWNIYVLNNRSYTETAAAMAKTAVEFKSDSHLTYFDLLHQAYLILRVQLLSTLSGHSDIQLDHSKFSNEFHETVNKLREICALLGEYCCRYDRKGCNEVVKLFKYSQLPLDQVMQRFFMTSEEQQFSQGIIYYLDHLLFQDNAVIDVSEKVADRILEIYMQVKPEVLSKVMLECNLKNYSAECGVRLLDHLHHQCPNFKFTDYDKAMLISLHLSLCDQEDADLLLAEINCDQLTKLFVQQSLFLTKSDDKLTLFGQFVYRHWPKAVIDSLLQLLDMGTISIHSANKILQVSSSGLLSNNFYLCNFLEQVVHNKRYERYFNDCEALLLEVYLLQLTEKQSYNAQFRGRLVNVLLIYGDGHFGKRYTWLDSLSPFEGVSPEHVKCQRVKRLKGNSPFSLRSPSSQANVYKSKMHTTCCCQVCCERLVKLQSFLCSKYTSVSAAQRVLDFVISKESEIQIACTLSLQLLCLPIVGQFQKATEILLEHCPNIAVRYTQDMFQGNVDLWICLYKSVLGRLKASSTGVEEGISVEVLKGLLSYLVTLLSPSQLLDILPDDGSAKFFLPYILKSYQWNLGEKMKKEFLDEL